MNTLELIEQTKTKLGIESDYALAKKLEIPDARISDYRHGKRAPDNYAIAKFAKALEIDPWSLVKELEAQTEKNPAKKEFWSKAATLFFFAVILNMSPTPAEATQDGAKSLSTLYIMLNAVRKLKQWLLQAFQMSIPKNSRRFLIPRVHHVTA